jgi:geranylgeranyl diphosphate synthase, type II
MQINPKLKLIQDELENKLSSKIPKEEKPLYNAARYVLENKGKRIRPLLTLCTCYDLKDGKIEQAYDAAIALEFVHNYSLIHDDLPCMDNDDERRGKPTVHIMFDEAIAVLTGDFFLTEAFSVILESQLLPNDRKIELSKLLSHYSGGGQLLEGQVIDLQMEGKIGHFYDLLNLYLRKTSSLFCCALEFGAVIANKDHKVQSLLKEVGQKIGLAFQIKNDFQGKKKDQQLEKFTILTLQTEKQAKILVDKTIHEAIELLEKSEHSFVELVHLIKTIFPL